MAWQWACLGLLVPVPGSLGLQGVSVSSPSGLPSSLLWGEQIRGCHLVSSASARHSGWEMARNPQPHDPRAPDARAGPALPLELGPQTQTHGPGHVALKVTQTRRISVDSDRGGEGWQVGQLPLHRAQPDPLWLLKILDQRTNKNSLKKWRKETEKK